MLADAKPATAHNSESWCLDAKEAFLRQWRGREEHELVHCMAIANDATVYVCNRYGNRSAVDKMGNFRSHRLPVGKSPHWYRPTADRAKRGATVALAFSRDCAKSCMYVVNQNNSQIDIVRAPDGQRSCRAGRDRKPRGYQSGAQRGGGFAEQSLRRRNRGRRIKVHAGGAVSL